MYRAVLVNSDFFVTQITFLNHFSVWCGERGAASDGDTGGMADSKFDSATSYTYDGAICFLLLDNLDILTVWKKQKNMKYENEIQSIWNGNYVKIWFVMALVKDLKVCAIIWKPGRKLILQQSFAPPNATT